MILEEGQTSSFIGGHAGEVDIDMSEPGSEARFCGELEDGVSITGAARGGAVRA